MRKTAFIITIFIIQIIYSKIVFAEAKQDGTFQPDTFSSETMCFIDKIVDNLFINFSITINESKGKKLKFWLEYYKKGELINKYFDSDFILNDKVKSYKLLFYNIEHPGIKNVFIWYIKLFSDFHIVNFRYIDENIFGTMSLKAFNKEYSKGGSIMINKDVVLAIYYSYTDNWYEPFEYIDLKYFTNKDDFIKILNKYDHIYFFKCRLIE